jgi:hypothetical protein
MKKLYFVAVLIVVPFGNSNVTSGKKAYLSESGTT